MDLAQMERQVEALGTLTPDQRRDFWLRQRINRNQKPFTAEQFDKLVENHHNRDKDHAPVVKFFDPSGAGTWLLSEFDPEDGNAFALCDLGMGSPELGYVNLFEIMDIQNVARRPFKMGIARDLHVTFDKPMSYYVGKAAFNGRIAV